MESRLLLEVRDQSRIANGVPCFEFRMLSPYWDVHQEISLELELQSYEGWVHHSMIQSCRPIVDTKPSHEEGF